MLRIILVFCFSSLTTSEQSIYLELSIQSNNMNFYAFELLSSSQVVEDHRPFDTDVSIETFFKKCQISLTLTRESPDQLISDQPYHYICRYRITALSKKKFNIEPVLEQERKALEYLGTPKKDVLNSSSRNTAKTPSSLVKRMGNVSLYEQKNWSISKTDGTKLLLKRAILADKVEKDSPKKSAQKSTPKKSTKSPKSSKKTSKNLEELISMELKENSDEEIPTLIIRQHVPTTPKRKAPVPKLIQETPKKALNFDDEEMSVASPYSATRSSRLKRNPVSYLETELSPVKRTPHRSVRKRNKSDNESDDEFLPSLPQTPKTPKTRRTPRTPTTPRTPHRTPGRTPHSVSRRIMTSQLTPTLHNRAHSVEKADGECIFQQNVRIILVPGWSSMGLILLFIYSI